MDTKQEKIAAELASIQTLAGGLLLPADVVRFARDPATALHGEFEWDDTEAARLHRLNQARQIIRAVVTLIENHAEPVRALVSLSSDRSHGGGYRQIEAVLRDDGHRRELLRDALRELLVVKRRYERIAELTKVWAALDAATAEAGEAAPG